MTGAPTLSVVVPVKNEAGNIAPLVAEIEAAITALTRRGDLGVLLVEQHIGFALESAQQ